MVGMFAQCLVSIVPLRHVYEMLDVVLHVAVADLHDEAQSHCHCPVPLPSPIVIARPPPL